MREPLKRTNKGQYETELIGMSQYAKEVAAELCKKYPNVDIIDIAYLFDRELHLAMSVELIKYGGEVDKQ